MYPFSLHRRELVRRDGDRVCVLERVEKRCSKNRHLPVPRWSSRSCHVAIFVDGGDLRRRRTSGRTFVGSTLAVSFVTEGELFKWAERRSWGTRTRDRLDAWLHSVVVLPDDRKVIRTWGTIAARADTRGRPRPANDTWVAACCLAKRLPLLTLNLRDFEDFEAHDGLTQLR